MLHSSGLSGAVIATTDVRMSPRTTARRPLGVDDGCDCACPRSPSAFARAIASVRHARPSPGPATLRGSPQAPLTGQANCSTSGARDPTRPGPLRRHQYGPRRVRRAPERACVWASGPPSELARGQEAPFARRASQTDARGLKAGEFGLSAGAVGPTTKKSTVATVRARIGGCGEIRSGGSGTDLRRSSEQGARLRTEPSHVTTKPASQAESVHVAKSWRDQQRFARLDQLVAKLFECGQLGELAIDADARPPLLLVALFAPALWSVQVSRPEAGVQVPRKLTRRRVCGSVHLWPHFTRLLRTHPHTNTLHGRLPKP